MNWRHDQKIGHLCSHGILSDPSDVIHGLHDTGYCTVLLSLWCEYSSVTIRKSKKLFSLEVITWMERY